MGLFNKNNYAVRTLVTKKITPLIESEVFFGDRVSALNYNYVSGLCYADQDGYFSVEFSPDSSLGWYGDTPTEYYALDPMNFLIPLTCPFFRIKFQNGTIAQTEFILYAFGMLL